MLLQPRTAGQLTPVQSLYSLVVLYREHVGLVLLYASFVGLLALITPVAVQSLVNVVSYGALLQPLFVLVTLLALALLMSGVARALKLWVVEALQRRLFVDVVRRVGERISSAGWQRTDAHREPHVAHRLFELFTIQKATAALLLGAVDLALTATVGLLVLAFYHPALLAFDVLLIAFIALLFALGRGAVASSVRESSAKYALVSGVSDAIASLQAGEAPSATVGPMLDARATDFLRARAVHFRAVYRQHLGALLMQVSASALLLGLGGLLVLRKELTLGQLVAAELISTAVVSSLSNVGKHFETFYDLVAAAYKLEGLTEPRAAPPGPALERQLGTGGAA